MGVGENESTSTKERKHEALATVRLVNKDGDVMWSTTQESNGAKFRGAEARGAISDQEVNEIRPEALGAQTGGGGKMRCTRSTGHGPVLLGVAFQDLGEVFRKRGAGQDYVAAGLRAFWISSACTWTRSR